jgi:hypothetical protein
MGVAWPNLILLNIDTDWLSLQIKVISSLT